MPTALYFARDPGPANQVVAAWLLGTEARPTGAPGADAFLAELAPFVPGRFAVARGPAVDVFARAGIATELPASDLADGGARARREAACRVFLRDRGVGAVVTGTSDVDEDLDRVFWSAARALGVASHAFLDHPANLRERFVEADGSLTLPDVIYAPDPGYADALAAAGIEPSCLRVAGPLHARRLAAARARTLAARATLRGVWGARPGDRVVLFASECGREMAAFGRPPRHDELDVLATYTAELGARPDAPATLLVVRPHPRDAAGKYDAWLAAAPTAAPRRVVSAAGAPEEAILAADLVAGIDSSMLREARALGQAHVSLVGADLSL